MMGVRESGGPRQGENTALRTCVGNAIITTLQNCHGLGLGLGRHIGVCSLKGIKRGMGEMK